MDDEEEDECEERRTLANRRAILFAGWSDLKIEINHGRILNSYFLRSAILMDLLTVAGGWFAAGGGNLVPEKRQ